MKSYKRLFLLSSTVSSIGLCVSAVTAVAATCESLTSLNLPGVAVTAAQTIPAGDMAAWRYHVVARHMLATYEDRNSSPMSPNCRKNA